MLRQCLRIVVWLAVAIAASVACAASNTAPPDLVRSTGSAVETKDTFVDLLDTPSAMSPLASSSLLNGIARAGNRLVAVGARGHILYSDDEGNSWKQARVPVSSDLTAVSFPTPQKGWAVGHDGVILHSSDGGESWITQLDGRGAAQAVATRYREASNAGLDDEVAALVQQGPDQPFLDVWFDDEITGYVVGAFNLLFRTGDGGVTWVPWLESTDNPNGLHLYAIRRIGNGLYIAGEQGLLLKFDPGQQKFMALECDYHGTFFGLAGTSEVVVAFGLRGNAYRSLNGGANWRKIETGVPTTLTGGTVTKDGRIVLVTLLGTLLGSHDDGFTFAPEPSHQGQPASALVETSTGTLALVGMRGVRLQAAK